MSYIGKDVAPQPQGTYSQSEIDTQMLTKVPKVTSTDNAIVRFDGTSGQVQNSSVVIDDNGNVGIGVTPSAWYSQRKTIQLGATGTLSARTVNDYLDITNNGYEEAGGIWKYIASSNNASRYYQQGGAHTWYTAPSGTAGNDITWTTAMTLDASGNLTVGNGSNPYSARMYVNKSIDPVMAVGDGNSNTDKNISFGFDTTNGFGHIQAYHNQYGPKPLSLQRFGGNLLVGTTTDNGVDKLQVNGSIKTNELKARTFYSFKDVVNFSGTFYILLFQCNNSSGRVVTGTAIIESWTSGMTFDFYARAGWTGTNVGTITGRGSKLGGNAYIVSATINGSSWMAIKITGTDAAIQAFNLHGFDVTTLQTYQGSVSNETILATY